MKNSEREVSSPKSECGTHTNEQCRVCAVLLYTCSSILPESVNKSTMSHKRISKISALRWECVCCVLSMPKLHTGSIFHQMTELISSNKRSERGADALTTQPPLCILLWLTDSDVWMRNWRILLDHSWSQEARCGKWQMRYQYSNPWVNLHPITGVRHSPSIICSYYGQLIRVLGT